MERGLKGFTYLRRIIQGASNIAATLILKNLKPTNYLQKFSKSYFGISHSEKLWSPQKTSKKEKGDFQSSHGALESGVGVNSIIFVTNHRGFVDNCSKLEVRLIMNLDSEQGIRVQPEQPAELYISLQYSETQLSFLKIRQEISKRYFL